MGIRRRTMADDDRDRFVSSDGLKQSNLLKNRDELDTMWTKYWPTIYGDLYIPLLNKEIRNNPKYKHIWSKATEMYRAKNKTSNFKHVFVNKYDEEYKAEDFHIAIVAYTMDAANGTTLYKDFNNASRGLTITNFKNFQFKSLWYMLGFALPQVRATKVSKMNRGLHDFQYPENDLRIAVENKTPVVLGTSFVSATEDWAEACQFARRCQDNPCKHIKCVIQFNGRANYGNLINTHSNYPNEKEVLICPWSQWIVESYNYQQDRQYQVVMVRPFRDQQLHPTSTNATCPDGDCIS